MKYFAMVACVIAVFVASAASAQESKIDGLPIKLGDSVAQVQEAFQTKLEAEPYSNSARKGGYQLRLRTKGVWTFFNKEGKADIIRIEAPFHGSICGVKIGDTVLTLQKQLGEPVKKPSKHGLGEEYLYYPDDTYSAKFIVNDSGEVETVFLSK